MKHPTGPRARTQRLAHHDNPTPAAVIAALSVNRVEVRASRYRDQLQHLDNLLNAHRGRITQLLVERRSVLARMAS